MMMVMAVMMMVAVMVAEMMVMVAKMMMAMVMMMAAAKMTSVPVTVSMPAVMVMLRNRPSCWNERQCSNQRKESQKPSHGDSSIYGNPRSITLERPSPPMQHLIIRVWQHFDWPPMIGTIRPISRRCLGNLTPMHSCPPEKMDCQQYKRSKSKHQSACTAGASTAAPW
jgi:hypothetical protein